MEVGLHRFNTDFLQRVVYMVKWGLCGLCIMCNFVSNDNAVMYNLLL